MDEEILWLTGQFLACLMASQRLLLLLLALSTLWYVSCFNARFTTTIATTHRPRFLGFHGLQMARDDEDRTKGIKSAAAGALAGGLIAGPVGAVLGFAVGDMMGGAKQTKSAQTDPAIRQAQALAADLGAAIEEAKNTKQQQENLLQQRKMDLSRFQAEADKLYELAKESLLQDREQAARAALEQRQALKVSFLSFAITHLLLQCYMYSRVFLVSSSPTPSLFGGSNAICYMLSVLSCLSRIPITHPIIIHPPTTNHTPHTHTHTHTHTHRPKQTRSYPSSPRKRRESKAYKPPSQSSRNVNAM